MPLAPAERDAAIVLDAIQASGRQTRPSVADLVYRTGYLALRIRRSLVLLQRAGRIRGNRQSPDHPYRYRPTEATE